MDRTTAEHKEPEVIFFEDFSTRQLDLSNWNVKMTGSIVNNELQAYVDSPETIYIQSIQETLGGTALVIQARAQPEFTTPEGNCLDFLSGRIDTKHKFEFKYGTASARMKSPVGSGLWPAFWALGNDPWPENGEIDIMENVGIPDWISAGVHGPGYSGESGLINQVYMKPSTDISTWHIYSVDWFPDQLHFRVDGKLMYRVTSEMVQFFGPWVFDNPKYLIINLAVGGKYPHKINGVTSPYYGLPEDTLKLIQEDQAKLYVDWVKVTKCE